MKLLKTTFLMIAAAAMMSGCLKNDEIEFEIYNPIGFAMQKQNGTVDAPQFSYLQYLAFYTIGKEAMETGSVSSTYYPGGMSQTVLDYYVETRVSSTYEHSLITDLSTTYYLSATSEKGTESSAAYQIAYVAEDNMGAIDVSSFSYDNNTGSLTAVVNNVTGADIYALLTIQTLDGVPLNNSYYGYRTVAAINATSNQTHTITLGNATSNILSNEMRVVPIAIKSTANGYVAYLIKTDEWATLKKDGTFVRDNQEE